MTPFSFPPHMPSSGWIEVVCGSMFSGKTEELIRRVKRATIARQRVQVFKPAIDNRYVADRVNSHAGGQIEAQLAHNGLEVWNLVHEDTQVVAVDEVQFFDPAIVEVCQHLADAGKRVICSGLDLDFRGEPFGLMPGLLAVAEHIEKLHAICMRCGGPASRTQRLIDGRPAHLDDPVILVGASEHYEARCRACHELAGRPKPPGAMRPPERPKASALQASGQA